MYTSKEHFNSMKEITTTCTQNYRLDHQQSVRELRIQRIFLTCTAQNKHSPRELEIIFKSNSDQHTRSKSVCVRVFLRWELLSDFTCRKQESNCRNSTQNQTIQTTSSKKLQKQMNDSIKTTKRTTNNTNNIIITVRNR